MNGRRVAWRAMADRLAMRLANHAHCGKHPESAPRDDCPFCEDRAVYLAYLAAGGTDWRFRAAGRSVSLTELASRPVTKRAEERP